MPSKFLPQEEELPRAAKAGGRSGTLYSRFFSLIPIILTRIRAGWLRISPFSGIHRPEAKLFPRKFRVILRKLLDLDELVLVHIGEVLARIGGGPPDFQSHNLRRFSQSDVLSSWPNACLSAQKWTANPAGRPSEFAT